MAGNSTESTHGSLDAGVPQAGGGRAAEPLYGAVFRESRGTGAVAAEKRARADSERTRTGRRAATISERPA